MASSTTTANTNSTTSPFFNRDLKSASPQVSEFGFLKINRAFSSSSRNTSACDEYVKPPFLPRLPEKLFTNRLNSTHLINGYYIDIINNNNKVRYFKTIQI